MTPLEKKLAAVYWDTDVDAKELRRLLDGDIDRLGHIDRINLCRRLLMTYDWHTLLAIIPQNRLHEALSDAVLDQICSEDLMDRYRYARRVLFG